VTNPCKKGSFEHLLKKKTLEIIYQKFKYASFTTEDVVTRVYWLGCIERHVQYMHRQGWIMSDDEGRFKFVIGPEKWVFGGEVY